MVLSSAVASGIITAVQAWPEYFEAPGASGAFPSRDADMSGFELEAATPESFAADMSALVRASQHVTIREDEPPPFPVLGLPDPEWP
jgi:hypothetical protein